MGVSVPATKNDIFTFHPLDELRQMTLAEVEALWELVPTDRQRLYKAIYDRTRRDEGASGSDALEAEMVSQLLDRYAQKGLVPVGSYWVPTPPQIKAAASENTEITRDDTDPASPPMKVSPLISGIGAICIVLLGILLLRGLGGSKKTSQAGLQTSTHVPTQTLARTYTPTPLALDAQDSIIRGGNAGSSSSLIFPVNLKVVLTDGTSPRIFVVQRRVIQTTEWNYDDNPDTASYISGLMVRPVLGIPWSEANAVLFDKASVGSSFTLQMNTGAVMRFVFSKRLVVNRSDTSAFRQVEPGLVLALIGEHNPETNETTPDRMLLLADYQREQELTSGDVAGMTLPLVDLPTPTVTLTPAQRIDAQIISVTSAQGEVNIHVRIYNGQYAPVRLDANSIGLVYGYAEHPVGPSVAAELDAFELQPRQAADMSMKFAWHGEPFATLRLLGSYEYGLTFRQESK